MTDATSGREISPELVAGLLGFVEVALGRDALDAVLSELPGHPTAEELTRPDRWCSRAEFGRMTAVAAALAGDPGIGRQVGLVNYHALLLSPNAELLRRTGSVHAALSALADYSSKMTVGRRFAVQRIDDRVALLVSHYDDGVPADRFACDATCGFFGALPGLFGCPSLCVEVECQARGDDRCAFRITWTPPPEDADPTAESRTAVRGISALEQLESHHEAAADLVRAQGVDDVLARIVRQVSTAIKAPASMLAVRLAGDPRPRVHRIGFARDDAEALADALERGEAPPPEAVEATIETASARGHLLAVMPRGTAASEHDRRVLASFAGYAASALEIVSALEDARAARDTATALLDLAHRLAEAGDLETVARTLAEQMPALVGSQLSTVWLHDQEADVMRVVAAIGPDGGPADLGFEVIETSGVPMEAMLVQREPQLVEMAALRPEERRMMERNGLVEALIFPVVSGERVVGMATAGFAEPVRPEARPRLLARLEVVIAQVGVAFTNASLLERIHHQAMHDDLTGLPTRALAEDRGATALARRARTGETVAVLFVDLDGFKEVNDSHGHAAGDHVLRQVAERLAGAMRVSDTCARLGGDEFLVVLSDLASADGAREVAERVIATFTEPFEVDGHRMSISCSVGIACAPPVEVGFEELLRRSDAAMYVAKSAGGGTYAVDGAEP